jgi:polygalacturonase
VKTAKLTVLFSQVRNSTFYTHDDGIALKSGKDWFGRHVGRPTENVLVRKKTPYRFVSQFTIPISVTMIRLTKTGSGQPIKFHTSHKMIVLFRAD